MRECLAACEEAVRPRLAGLVFEMCALQLNKYPCCPVCIIVSKSLPGTLREDSSRLAARSLYVLTTSVDSFLNVLMTSVDQPLPLCHCLLIRRQPVTPHISTYIVYPWL